MTQQSSALEKRRVVELFWLKIGCIITQKMIHSKIILENLHFSELFHFHQFKDALHVGGEKKIALHNFHEFRFEGKPKVG